MAKKPKRKPAKKRFAPEKAKPVLRLYREEDAPEKIPIRHVETTQPIEQAEPIRAYNQPHLLPINRPMSMPLDDQKYENFELPPLTLLQDPEPFPRTTRLREGSSLCPEGQWVRILFQCL